MEEGWKEGLSRKRLVGKKDGWGKKFLWEESWLGSSLVGMLSGMKTNMYFVNVTLVSDDDENVIRCLQFLERVVIKVGWDEGRLEEGFLRKKVGWDEGWLGTRLVGMKVGWDEGW